METALRRPRPADVPGLMLSVKELHPYYEAIFNQLRPQLRSIALSVRENFLTVFDYSLEHPLYGSRNRTPRYILLETKIADGVEMLEALYTPFGMLRLLAWQGHSNEDDMLLSKRFLDEFDWKIEDVTGIASECYYFQQNDEIRGPWGWKVDGSRMYIVQCVGQIHFVSTQDTFKSILFSELVLEIGQDHKDRATLEELSLGSTLAS